MEKSREQDHFPWQCGYGGLSTHTLQEHSTSPCALTCSKAKIVSSAEGLKKTTSQTCCLAEHEPMGTWVVGTHSGQGFLDVLSGSCNVTEDHAGTILLQTVQKELVFFALV